MSKEHDERKGKKEIPVEEISQLLGVVGDKVPHLIKSIKEVVYSPEAGKGMGQAVGNFYKELVASGIDTELASSLTRDYLSTMKRFSEKLNQHGGMSVSPIVMGHKMRKHYQHGECSSHHHDDDDHEEDE